MQSAKRQQGVALLMAMLVVAIASVSAVALVHEQSFSVRKTYNLERFNSALTYAMGLEDFARLYLQKDARESNTDSLDEDWAVGIPPLPIEGGFLTGSVVDGQSLINLNDLPGREATRQQLRQLCVNLELDPAFIPALVDWIDENLEAEIPEGAEDDYYTALEQPYRAANRRMTDVSELRLVKGIDAETFITLEPYLSTLPTNTELNLNTIPVEIFESIGLGVDGAAFAEAREQDAFASVDDFATRMNLVLDEQQKQFLSVSSRYFIVSGLVNIGEKSLAVESLIYRVGENETRVLSRKLGGAL